MKFQSSPCLLTPVFPSLTNFPATSRQICADTKSQVTCYQSVAASFGLLALFFARPSFVFNRLQTLFPKCRGGGVASRTLLRDTAGGGTPFRPIPPLPTVKLSAPLHHGVESWL